MNTHMTCHDCGFVVPLQEVRSAWVTPDGHVFCPECSTLMYPERKYKAVLVLDDPFREFIESLDL